MKRNVILFLTVMLCCFFAGGIYIILSFNKISAELKIVSVYTQVQTLQKKMHSHISTFQDGLLQQASEEWHIDSANRYIAELGETAEGCTGCHSHDPATMNQLNEILERAQTSVQSYVSAVSERDNDVTEKTLLRVQKEARELHWMIDSLTTMSSHRLTDRAIKVKEDIDATHRLIIALVIIGPIALVGATAIMLRRFTRSISALVKATEHFEGGELKYRIHTPMKNEFKLLADSFNRMGHSLEQERKNLVSMHRLYRTLFESAGEAICILSAEEENLGQIISVNQAACNMYGFELQELLSMNCMDLTAEESAEQFKEMIGKILAGEWVSRSVSRTRKDGSSFPAEISAGPLELDGRRYILSLARDITERQQAHKELLRANQLSIAGQMAVGLGHEIKNPLAGIKATLEVLGEDLELDDYDRSMFERARGEVARMEKLLKSLLNYARPPQPHFDRVDINLLLEQTLKNVELTAAKSAGLKVTFTRFLAVDLPQVDVDSAQLQQVFLNILINALDALEDKEGRIGVMTNVSLKGVVIEISDTGKGMDEATLAGIFNPFFTTKSKGTGLGLSICQRLIEQHGGSIEAESQVGKGTIFRIRLPITHTSEGEPE
ncbi:MAG: hypothetical protein C0622_12600 [Desulfuromonas sp.]|nr:MAG: hypothetical protein C0622_12600 [Desulfuromonas sp.]